MVVMVHQNLEILRIHLVKHIFQRLVQHFHLRHDVSAEEKEQPVVTSVRKSSRDQKIQIDEEHQFPIGVAHFLFLVGQQKRRFREI